MNEYKNIINYINEAPSLVQLAIVTSTLLFFIIVMLILRLKSIRSSLRIKNKEIAKYRKEYEPLLIEYLYSENEQEGLSETQQSIILKLKKEIRDVSRRKSVITILSNLMNEVSGEMSDSIRILYHKTGLVDYALLRLKNKNWHILSKAIRELTLFKIEEVHDIVVSFKNHARPEVRKEAHLYLVNLYSFKGLTILDDLKAPLSEWDQLLLLESLLNFDDQQIGDIKPWLKSTNTSVVLFALKLAKIYSQYEVKNEMIDLLTHTEKEIRVSVIDVLTQLFSYEAKEILKADFYKFQIDEQISFFETLVDIAEPSDLSFLEKHVYHKNAHIQILAMKILKSITQGKFIALNNLLVEVKSIKKLKPKIAI